MTLNLKGLGSRAIIGAFFKRLEEAQTAGWTADVATMFNSNQESETYTFLSDSPSLTEWSSNRTAQSMKRFEFSVKNKKFSAGLQIDEDDLRRDKTGQILVRVNELAARAAQLPQRIISDLLIANGNAYDGVAFYASTHKTESGATVDNLVTQVCTATGVPTVAEAASGILTAITRIMSFVDDSGEPRNEFARRFAVMVPAALYGSVVGAIRNDFLTSGSSNQLMATGMEIVPYINSRLTSSTVAYVFRTDADVRAFVWQDEVAPMMSTLEEGSDFHTLNDARMFFAKRVCNGGYGRFDQTVRLTFN